MFIFRQNNSSLYILQIAVFLFSLFLLSDAQFQNPPFEPTRRRKIEGSSEDIARRDIVTLLPQAYFDNDIEAQFGLQSHPLESFERKKFFSPTTSSENGGFVFNPKGAFSHQEIGQELAKLSIFQWHGNMDTIDAALKAIPTCDNGLWIDLFMKAVHRHLHMYKDVTQFDLVDTEFYIGDITKTFLIYFASFETVNTYSIAKQEMEQFLKKIRSFCPGIEQAQDGAWVYLLDSITLLHSLDTHLLHYSGAPHLTKFIHRNQENFLYAFTLYKESYMAMTEFYHRLPVFKTTLTKLIQVANARQFRDEHDFYMTLHHMVEDSQLFLTHLNCTITLVEETALKHHYEPSQDKEMLAKTLDLFVSEVMEVLAPLTNLRMMDRFSRFAVFSYDASMRYTFDAEPHKHCSQYNIP